ncbi:hypothetical protein AGMMS49953_07450 [Endomicrobiia bacterium]|uniref:hypothetical protein n=1 Tax=Endomicrobium trichonymphae TaxID=1408204 RepID=UPI000BBB4C9B|nr:hypothetical protein [Candidatus Endomicrobium trichonymphae]GHT24600.1 hypothetical protein AGMMS49953_07450 [Endomicrobiia bacterium]
MRDFITATADRAFTALVAFIVLAVVAFAHSKDDNLNDILKKTGQHLYKLKDAAGTAHIY